MDNVYILRNFKDLIEERKEQSIIEDVVSLFNSMQFVVISSATLSFVGKILESHQTKHSYGVEVNEIQRILNAAGKGEQYTL